MQLKSAVKAYKVCRKENGHYKSSNSSTPVGYAKNKVTYPRKMKGREALFVFSSLKRARDFISGVPQRYIFEGMALNPRHSMEHYDGSKLTCRDCPVGTIFCDAFLPLKIVE